MAREVEGMQKRTPDIVYTIIIEECVSDAKKKKTILQEEKMPSRELEPFRPPIPAFVL